ncbi:MAG: hypothetical protein C4320_05245, partial [Armatimonadota bacterium]
MLGRRREPSRRGRCGAESSPPPSPIATLPTFRASLRDAVSSCTGRSSVPSDPLPLTDLLDARVGADPFPGFVPIPWPELRARRGELPPPGSALHVLGPREAFEVLTELGYVPVPADARGGEITRGRLFSVDPLVIASASETPSDVLDLGGGIGRNAVWLAAGGHRVTAVDRIPKLAHGAAVMAERYGTSLTARTEYVEAVLKEPRAYDLVLLLFCWDRAFARALAPVVRPGGRVVIATFLPDGGHTHPVARERCLEEADAAA